MTDSRWPNEYDQKSYIFGHIHTLKFVVKFIHIWVKFNG